MAVADITIWMIFLALFNYAIVYRKNKFFGSIGYLVMAILFYGIRVEFGYTQTMYGYIALFIMAGAIMNLIYEVIGKMRQNYNLG
jgi:hypothetical protein